MNNQFGANRYGVIANVGFGADPNVGDVTVTDNTQTAPTGGPGECWAPVRILGPEAVYRRGWVFRRNRFFARRNGFEFRRLKNVEVSSNNLTMTPVGITSNVFSGANYVYTTDTLSTGITSAGDSIN